MEGAPKRIKRTYEDWREIIIKNGLDAVMSRLDEFDINAQNESGAGLLHFIVSMGCAACFATILARDDVDLNLISYDWGSPLCLALKRRPNEIVMRLVDDDRTDVNARWLTHATPLELACRRDDPEIAKHLLYRGAKITDLIKSTDTPTAKFIVGHAMRWTPDTHKYHRRRVRERIEWWRAYCKRTKRVYKDIEFFICEIVARTSR